MLKIISVFIFHSMNVANTSCIMLHEINFHQTVRTFEHCKINQTTVTAKAAGSCWQGIEDNAGEAWCPQYWPTDYPWPDIPKSLVSMATVQQTYLQLELQTEALWRDSTLSRPPVLREQHWQSRWCWRWCLSCISGRDQRPGLAQSLRWHMRCTWPAQCDQLPHVWPCLSNKRYGTQSYRSTITPHLFFLKDCHFPHQ